MTASLRVYKQVKDAQTAAMQLSFAGWLLVLLLYYAVFSRLSLPECEA